MTPSSSQSHTHIAAVGSFSYRLLYRGALSLPDSYILLDGLTFSARLPGVAMASQYDSPSNSHVSDSLARDLIHHPLALALESMRGRPSLRFKGTVYLNDIWIDEAVEVYMDIHPLATLSRIYFENILCLSPLVPVSRGVSGTKRTEVGVRVALGDTDGPETTEIVIYGETSGMLHLPSPASAASSSMSPGSHVIARVARIMPAPRAPRPDDPTPRKPPVQLCSGSAVGELGANKRVRARPSDCKVNIKVNRCEEDDVVQRAREVMLHLPRSVGSSNEHTVRQEGGVHRSRQRNKGAGMERQKSKDSAIFKVPEVPDKARKKDLGTDVFGTVEHPRSPTNAGGGARKGKGKTRETEPEVEGGCGSVEATNKLLIKKSAVRFLGQVGIPRSHHEFKDIFGFVYRGTAFALRAQMRITSLSMHMIDALVEAHVKLYVTPKMQDMPTGNSRK
ncbi:hypothetical protein ID866_962 [Astraeus odoratus]|nr:hypothetical protein ID866_962 [Astraeus odoratus]